MKSYESVEPSANISQLDSLLNDLKQERDVPPFDKGESLFDIFRIFSDSFVVFFANSMYFVDGIYYRKHRIRLE